MPTCLGRDRPLEDGVHPSPMASGSIAADVYKARGPTTSQGLARPRRIVGGGTRSWFWLPCSEPIVWCNRSK